MNRKTTVVFLVAAAAALSGRAGALVYDEKAERVTLGQDGQQIVFQWDAKANGFVTQRGDWIAWDTGANGWLMVPKSGARARFDAAGNFMGREQLPAAAAPQKPVKSVAVGGYDPTADAGDSGKGGGADTKAAFDYLAKRDAALAGSESNSVAGDSGGGAIAVDALGGDDVARRRLARENFKMRPGAHANDPDGVLETGAVKDPLQELMDSMQSLSKMASGVQDTIQGAQDLEKQIKDFPNATVPPIGKQPTPSDNNPMPPAQGGVGGGQPGFPPGGGYGQQPGYPQQPGYAQPGYGGTLVNGQPGGYGGFGGFGGGGNPGTIGGKPPIGQQQHAGSAVIPQGAVPQGGVQSADGGYKVLPPGALPGGGVQQQQQGGVP